MPSMPIKPLQMDMFSPFEPSVSHGGIKRSLGYKEVFRRALNEDLNFQGQDSSYATHNFHAFPAKFPPQLPRKFINSLTVPGEWVLDPMVGSGTTVVEAVILGRNGVGIDIDPLALNLCKVKVTPLDPGRIIKEAKLIVERAERALRQKEDRLWGVLNSRFDPPTKKFVDYWFSKETQFELLALMQQIEALADIDVRRFF
jgi:hypothetical protein